MFIVAIFCRKEYELKSKFITNIYYYNNTVITKHENTKNHHNQRVFNAGTMLLSYTAKVDPPLALLLTRKSAILGSSTGSYPVASNYGLSNCFNERI